MVLHEPLDLQYWLVNTFSGSWEIFWFVALIAIAGLAARFKMNNLSFIVILGLFSVLMASSGASWMLMVACILGGFAIFFSISNIIKH